MATVALVFSPPSLELQNGTAAAVVVVQTRTLGPLTRAVLAGKVAAVTVHGVPTALVKMEPTAQVAAVAAVTVKVKAAMAEVALSSFPMFSQLQPLQLQQPPPRLLALQQQRLLLL